MMKKDSGNHFNFKTENTLYNQYIQFLEEL